MLAALLALLPAATAVQTQTFKAPADCPVCVSDNYTGHNNGSLVAKPVVPGKGEFLQVLQR